MYAFPLIRLHRWFHPNLQAVFDSFPDHDASEIDWVKLKGGHQYEFVFENDVSQPLNAFASYASFKSVCRCPITPFGQC